jgi:hypothetical protein
VYDFEQYPGDIVTDKIGSILIVDDDEDILTAGRRARFRCDPAGYEFRAR